MKILIINPGSEIGVSNLDIFTIEEIKKKIISKLNISWIGDSNNVLNSLIAASIKFDFRLKIGCPKEYQPKKFVLDMLKKNHNKVCRTGNNKQSTEFAT